MKITQVRTSNKIWRTIQKRGLSKQFLKQIECLYNNDFIAVDLKLRKPKNAGIWYFKINKQYRAWCRLDGTIFDIFHIDNHQ